MEQEQAIIDNIQRFCIHDGPGIRTTVFFKGCNLSCTWCANPETQKLHPEKMWDNSAKGYCIHGTKMTIDDVMAVVCRDRDYYEESSGGVTLSGGEYSLQSNFAFRLLQRCKAEGIHTAVETAGFTPRDTFIESLQMADLIIMDIKHHSSEQHKKFTGVPNDVILGNLRLLVENKADFSIRIPVIPGVNNSLDDAKRFAALFLEYGVEEVELLPFHQYGKNKYDLLGREYTFKDVSSLRSEDLVDFRDVILEAGIKCIIA